MGRQELTQHIEAQLSGRAENVNSSKEICDTLCQHCGTIIETDGPQQDDYVVHSIPEHGGDDASYVFYCSPDCFQDQMDVLFEP